MKAATTILFPTRSAMSEHLSASQRDILTNFREIAGLDDEPLCIQILQSNNWNLEASINSYVNDPTTAANPSRGSHREQARSSGGQGHHQQRVGQLQGHQTIFDFVLGPLKWLFQVTPTSLNPERDALKFINSFDVTYGSNHPAFHAGSYHSAVTEAHRTSKTLLIYLHSPFHDDTDDFCRHILCSENMAQITPVRDVLIWVGCIWDPEAYSLSASLKVVSFPFTAVAVCQSARAIQVVDRIQGNMSPPVYFERLGAVVAASAAAVSRQRESTARR